jgi:GT2 family glycosyltransferase
MAKFNPLDHPICFSYPLRLAAEAELAHVPFAMFLVDLLHPKVLVQLGAREGIVFCAYSQAVKELRLNTRCFAISDWQNGHSERGDSSALADLRAHHDPLYGNFSQLIDGSPTEPHTNFENGAVDLLHIGGCSSSDVARRWIETWLPKMSDRGVIVLGKTNFHDPGFDVWKLWREIKAVHPYFEFAHQGGLGVLSVGTRVPDGLRPLVEATAAEASLIREFFSQLGERLRTRLENKPLNDGLHSRVKDLCLQLQEKKDELAEKESTIKSLIEELGVAEKETEKRRWEANQLSAEMNQLSARFTYLSDKERRLNDILNSRAWRWVSRYGRIKNRFITPAYQLIKPVPDEVSAKPPSTDEYRKWVDEYDALTNSDRKAIRARIENLQYQPLISVIMPVYDVDEMWLRAAIESVRRQIYANWELCIADDASHKPHVRMVLEEYTAMDSRIKVVFRQQNGHISAASNSALELATGGFTVLLDHDDEIPEHALYMVVEELNSHPETDLIYSDEDKIDEQGERCGPHFKPEFSPDLLYSYNMISHLGVYRTSIVKKIGGFREGFEGSQDYDLALRVIEQISANHIRHIPHILYHWRAIPGSVAMDPYQKEYAHEAARNAIRSHLKRMEIPAFVTQGHGFYHRVTYPVPTPAPLVSIIMGTRDRVDLLRSAVGGFLEQTYYQPVELIIVNNQSHDPATLAFLREIDKDERIKVINYDAPFNYAAINNLGVKQSKGEIVCLINNDIKVISPDWLKEMVSHALRPEIGAVGAKLYYPNNKVQHAGIILGVSGIAEHAHRRFSREIVGYVARTHVLQNFSAVTGACMVLRRQVFDEVNGLDEVNLPIAFNDIDFCLRIQERGYRILWTPYAELYHVESASRGFGDIQRISRRFRNEISYMKKKWGHVIANDPYYNQNLTLKDGDFSLAFPPRAPKPWLKSDHRS